MNEIEKFTFGCSVNKSKRPFNASNVLNTHVNRHYVTKVNYRVQLEYSIASFIFESLSNSAVTRASKILDSTPAPKPLSWAIVYNSRR